MSKTKIIFHGSQQFIEKDADDLQAHNFEYTDKGLKHLTKNADGEHSTLTTNQSGQISFIVNTVSYATTPPTQTVKFNDFAFVDTAGALYIPPNDTNFDVSADMNNVNDFFLGQGGNPNFPDANILNSAVPRFSLWIKPTLTDVAQENRNFINVNTQVVNNVFTRQQHTYEVKVSQASPGAGYFDVGTLTFLFPLGRTTPEIQNLTFSRDILAESGMAVTNTGTTRFRKGVINRLSQRVGDAVDTIYGSFDGALMDQNVDAFTQDRNNLPRLSLAGLEQRTNNITNNQKLAVFGVLPHNNHGDDVDTDEVRGVASLIAQCRVEFKGSTFVDASNALRDSVDKFNPALHPCYSPSNKVVMASSSNNNPASAPFGFGNYTISGGTTVPVLYLHNQPATPKFYLRLNDDFHEKYFISDVFFTIERNVIGGHAVAEACPAVHQFFSTNQSSHVTGHAANNYISRLANNNLYAFERSQFDTSNNFSLANELSDASANLDWQNQAQINNYLEVNTSLIIPRVQLQLKQAVFDNAQSGLQVAMQQYYGTQATFDNLDSNGVALPGHIFPEFTLKVHVIGYPRHVDREGIAAGTDPNQYVSPQVLGL